jgi:hypothetical protein
MEKEDSVARDIVGRIRSYYRRERKAINENFGLIVALLAATAAIWSGYEAHLGRIDAANLGRDMLQAHVEATRLDERPFIVPSATGWRLDSHAGAQSAVILLSLKARATGRTPAFDVNIREGCILDPNPFTHLPDFSSLEPAFQLTPILAGNEESSMDCPVTRGSGEQGYIRAYGELLYVDLFRQNHTATFCFVVEDDHTGAKNKGKLEPCFGFVPNFT